MINRFPHFYIIGAPKCGTTSLAAWLAAHEQIFMCTPKEPYYFSIDIASQRAAASDAEYLALFRSALPFQKIGEASTTYLRSNCAVPLILQRQASTRFVVCLRNPVDMMPSVHMQLFRGGRETISDPAEAWHAQEKRKFGQMLPNFCPEPADLNYSYNCGLGAQVARLLDHVSRRQVHFILSEDMRKKPEVVYRDVLKFLEIPDDGRKTFEVYNMRRAPRSAIFSQALARISSFKARIGLKNSIGIGNTLSRLNSRKERKPSLSDAAFRHELKSFFESDIRLLEKAIERDLSHWLN